MEKDKLNNSIVNPSNTDDLVSSSILKMIIEEMQESLKIRYVFDDNTKNRFSCLNKGKYNPFGFDNIRVINKNNSLFYKRNRLRHKLVRIYNEFKFVNSNIHLYLKLTTREKEIIQLLISGFNNPEIAKKLFISRYTVEQHRKHINQKLRIKSSVDLFRFGYAFDLM